MTTEHERNGALEAVERVVNRGGEEVIAETLVVLRRLYPDVELRNGSFEAAGEAVDRRLLDRAAVLVSHFDR